MRGDIHLPTELWERALSQVCSDPGIPVKNPTTSSWQIPPNPDVSQIQSAKLPQNTDYAIIGSGLTGCSIAKQLLEGDGNSDVTVTVFEARTLSSGASGRNGGVLATNCPYTFPAMLERYGRQTAIEIVKFMYETLEKLYTEAESNEEIRLASEIRRTRDITGFWDLETFNEMKTSFLLLEKMVPESNLKVEVLSPEAALKNFGINTVGGALRFNNGAFWPYRFVTTMWKILQVKYAQRLNVETNTPVEKITYDNSGERYLVHTPRGTVKAKKIVHATNGYIGHLLPRLRRKIFPLRGYMSTQEPSSNFGQYGHDRTWSFFGDTPIDTQRGLQPSAVYYGSQSPNTNIMFWGSDFAPLDGMITADDSIVPEETRADLATALPARFPDWPVAEAPKIHEMWSGTMGYTADGLPLVGELTFDMTGRGVSGGEWICAGFNGAGTCQCWSTGQAVADMMMGRRSELALPKPYLVTSERLRDQNMNAEKCVTNVYS